MILIDADKLRERLKESNPTPYDAKFMAMINELAFETDVNQDYYQELWYKQCITNRVDSVERLTRMIDSLESGTTKGNISDYCNLIELRCRVISGIG